MNFYLTKLCFGFCSQIAYCPIPRTGLTVWNRYFITMAHIPYWPQWLTKMWWLVRKIYNMPDCLSREEMGQMVNNRDRTLLSCTILKIYLV